MTNPYDYSNTLSKAASRARHYRLSGFYDLVGSGQSRVSAKKLAKLLEELEESERLDSIHFRYLADNMDKQKSKIEELEKWIACIADDHHKIPDWIQQSARSLLASQ